MDGIHFVIALAATLCSCAEGSLPVASKPSSAEVASLLKVIDGDFSLNDLHALKDFVGSGTKGLQKFLNFSPMAKSIAQKTAQENIKAKILFSFLSGHTPSLDDLIKFATTKSEKIERTFSYIMNNDPKMYQIHKLTNGTQLTNHTAVKEALEIVAGRKIDVNAIKLKNDKYTVSERADQAYYNLLKLVYFFTDNFKGLRQISIMLEARPANYETILSLITNLNYTSFPRTTVGPNAWKYSVTNPDATNLLNDVKTKYPQILAQHDSKKATDAVLDFVGVLLEVFETILGQAENLGQKESDDVKQ